MEQIGPSLSKFATLTGRIHDLAVARIDGQYGHLHRAVVSREFKIGKFDVLQPRLQDSLVDVADSSLRLEPAKSALLLVDMFKRYLDLHAV